MRRKRLFIYVVCCMFYGNVVFSNVCYAKSHSNSRGKSQLEVYSNFNFYSETDEVQDKVKQEMKYQRTKLKSNVEEKLNCAGVFDDELKKLDNETIKALNESSVISISTECIEERAEEGDTVFNSIDFDEFYDLSDEKNNKSVSSSILNFITDTKYANAKTYSQSDSSTTSGGKFKHTLYACNALVGKEHGMRYTYQADWLTTPVNNEIDSIELSLGNCTIKKSTNTFYGDADLYVRNMITTTGVSSFVRTDTFSSKKDVVKNACSGGNAVRVVTFDLPGGKHGIQDYLIFKNPYILVTGYATISNISDKPRKFTVDAFYKHCETSTTINLSPSINTSGTISYSITANEEKHYNYLTNGLNLVVDVNMNMTK